jgi:hypothetical protein
MVALGSMWAGFLVLAALIEGNATSFPTATGFSQRNPEIQTRQYWQTKWNREKELIDKYRTKESGQEVSTPPSSHSESSKSESHH